VEERAPRNADALLRRYVWGNYIDALFQQREYWPDDQTVRHDYFPISDLHHRTVALTDEHGCVAEAYDADAYGRTLICHDLAGACLKRLPLCSFIYTGRRYDP